MDITKLVTCRRYKKIRQPILAKAIGVSTTTLSKYESGRSFPTIDVLEKWIDFLGFELMITSKPEKL